MIVACHQANYIPWLGYFDKMDRCDIFVFLDTVQYKKREYINRNLIATRTGPRWLTVPVQTSGKYYQQIREVVIDNTQNWQARHRGMFEESYRKAPYFREVMELMEEFWGKPWKMLGEMNMTLIKRIAGWLGIKCSIMLESDIGTSTQKTSRLIEITRKLGADTYLSGAGARDYLDEEEFSRSGLKLIYQDFVHPVYSQACPSPDGSFIFNLSVLDLLVNEGYDALGIIRKTRKRS